MDPQPKSQTFRVEPRDARTLGCVSDWNNPCGGKRWRTLPSGLIEVEGEGYPAYQPGSAAFSNLSRTWSNWSSMFQSAASDQGLPVAWMLAIATTETGAWSNDPNKQATIVSYAGAVGIMQIMPQFQPETASDLAVPRINVAVGARILAKLSSVMHGELPAIASGYNAGAGSSGPHCSAVNEWNMASDANYPRQVLQYNNAAILNLKLNALSTMGMMLGGSVAAGLALAAYKYWPR